MKRTTLSGRPLFCLRLLLAAVLVLSVAGPGGCSDGGQPAGGKEYPPPPAISQPAGGQMANQNVGVNLVTGIEQVAQRTIPAVVHIEVTERREIPQPFLPFMNDPFFRHFFGNPEPPGKMEQEIKGIGTGMLMDAQGHILTNYHVAGGATKINVLLADGRTFSASLVGGDPKTDLAVIQIKASGNLPQVTFGDSNKVQVGQWVVAIGHPQGFNQTVTQGIISAKHRSGITEPTSYEDFLQTDAAINPGNSGGPLLDLRGEVIGVNTAIASTTGGFQGIGFAIPSNMALHVAKQILQFGEVKRGWLGVSVQDVTADLAKALGLKQVRGALVADVMPNSPASRAGIEKGDVIVTYRGQEMADASALRNAVATTPIGEQVKIDLLRNGQRQEVTATIGNLEKEQGMLTSSVEKRLGAKFRAVPPAEASKVGLAPGQGVEITAIGEGPLARSGLEKDDFILAVGEQPVDSPATLAALIRQLPPGQTVPLLVMDHRTGQTVQVQISLR
ncbi:MAG: Do family serine endopeptidase [Desulfobacteraceae bacterium]|nr:Do family serine endopeptidase [Desulfobacteraceae bacterium]